VSVAIPEGINTSFQGKPKFFQVAEVCDATDAGKQAAAGQIIHLSAAEGKLIFSDVHRT